MELVYCWMGMCLALKLQGHNSLWVVDILCSSLEKSRCPGRIGNVTKKRACGMSHLCAMISFYRYSNFTAPPLACREGCRQYRILRGYFEKEICQGIIFHWSQPGALWVSVRVASGCLCLLQSSTILTEAVIPGTNPEKIQDCWVWRLCSWSECPTEVM